MKFKLIIAMVTSFCLLTACTDLSETLYDKVESENYGKTPQEIATIVGNAYSSLRGGSDPDYGGFFPTDEFVFFISAVSSDECIIPTRVKGDWGDGGVYIDLHKHTWRPDNPKLVSGWRYAYNGINSVNSIIKFLEKSGYDQETDLLQFAELKALRAYYHWKAMDLYGNVPIVTGAAGEVASNTLSSSSTVGDNRTKVFEFIESELLNSIEYLPTNAYGRVSQNVANLLLARLYLNAEVYIGTPRWDDAIEYASKVNGELESDYFASFKAENHKSKEIIFSITYDSSVEDVGNYLASMTYHYDQKYAFSASGDYQWCGNGICGQPGLYSAFEATDIRRKALLEGPQIDLRTGDVISMTGYNMPLIYTEEISDFTNAPQNEGVRLHKYEAKAGDKWHRDYDMVLMRYAEVLTIQAEAYARKGDFATARTFIEPLRTRAGLSTPATINLNFIDQELRREFVFEDHRRTDNIRFGTFFDANWEKPADPADKHTGIFPVPTAILTTNPNLKQNPGY